MCVANINMGAMRDNARALVATGGDLPLLADVSADGHGHGAVQAATAALEGGASWLSVSSVADAATLRHAGIRAPILASFLAADQAQDAASWGLAVRVPGVELPRFFEPGIALYGLGSDSIRWGVSPAMRVSARVVMTKAIGPGDGVSYGYTFRAASATNLAMVAIGYADGLDRSAGNVASMLLGGTQRTIAGRVAMNAAVLDLGEDQSSVGEEAVLFGGAGEPSVRSWASAIGISEDEVVTVFGRSLARSYR
ncbi:MAG: alanine racemase C-terminal domain-containing protein [Lacisediminihabitans sp.]